MNGDIKEVGFLHKPESCYRRILLEILERGFLNLIEQVLIPKVFLILAGILENC